MFGSYRVVCVTPAGRRRYLRLLAPQILRSSTVDEYQLWANTTDPLDLAYLRELEAHDTRVRVVESRTLPAGQTASIRQFFRACTDDDAVYVRFDDDIVFVEPDFFDKLLGFRIAHPEYFLVFPNTINNALCTYTLAQSGTIQPRTRVHPWCMDVMGWANPRLAEQLHRAFLASLEEGNISRWYFGPRLLAGTRYSVNCMSWLGSEFAGFLGEVPSEEEEYLTVTKPGDLMKANCIYGDTVVAHFAFIPQRAHLDATDILDRYAAIAALPPLQTRAARDPAGPIDLWAPRLRNALLRISTAALGDLRSVGFVADLIRDAGLVFDRRMPYGPDNRFMNTEKTGINHVPLQLAACLVELSAHPISTMLDASPGNGWRTCVVVAYLLRFNPALRAIVIGRETDVADIPANTIPIKCLPLADLREYAKGTVDLVLLDDREARAQSAEAYRLVGRDATLCMVDGIHDGSLSASNKGGDAPRSLWGDLRQSEAACHFLEFAEHGSGAHPIGIGLLIRFSRARLRVTHENRAQSNDSDESFTRVIRP